MTGAAVHFPEVARERLREFGIALEIEAPAHALSGDAIVTLSRGNATARYEMHVLKSMTLSALVHGKVPTPAHPLLIIGDRISRRSAAAFREAGIQFVDALGNAFVTFGDVLVEVHGRTGTTIQAARTRHPANIFSPRRAQVGCVLLSWPELATAKVRDVATAAGVSVGQAHDSLVQLEEAGFLVPGSRRLHRVDELLDFWAAAYPGGLGRRLRLAEYHGDPARSVTAGQPVFLSGEAAEGTEIARPATLTVYVEALDPKMPILNRWSSSPDRVPNVYVRRKFWISPRPDAEGAAASGQNAPWPIVYADLLAAGDARLGEVARAWRSRRSQLPPPAASDHQLFG